MGQINFDAYPRSGNTFTNLSMLSGLVNVDYGMHKHNAHKLLSTPNRFTVVRNPLDAISSAIVCYSSLHDKRVDRFTEWYVDYYNQCFNKGCLFIDFNNLIADPKKTFISIVNKFLIKEHNFDSLDFSLFCKNATESNKKEQVIELKDEILHSKHYVDAIKIYKKTLFESKCAI